MGHYFLDILYLERGFESSSGGGDFGGGPANQRCSRRFNSFLHLKAENRGFDFNAGLYIMQNGRWGKKLRWRGKNGKKGWDKGENYIKNGLNA